MILSLAAASIGARGRSPFVRSIMTADARGADAAFDPPDRAGTGDGAAADSARCGALRCQQDSYLRTLQTRVKSCTPSREKKEMGKVWEVCLNNTVLFPEGGGQPCDVGTIGAARVLRVSNIDGEAVHCVDAPLEVGCEVEVSVDWERRTDLMHQHSAQHLITALAIDMFGYETLSWDLKPDATVSTTLDLGVEELKPEEMELLEQRTNEAIRAGHKVAPRWIAKDSKETEKIRCRGLPEGVAGPLRVLEIEGIDTNLCCGTHVKSTAHLSQVKLLHTERVRDRGKTHVRLHFAAGGRILTLMDAAWKRQLRLNGLLAMAPENHAASVEGLLASKKEQTKDVKALLGEVADFLVERLRRQAVDGERVLDVHREKGDMDLMKQLASALDGAEVLLLTTFGGPGAGTFMLSGPAGSVAQLGPKVATILEGRGGGKGRYQGKAENIAKRTEALEMLRKAVAAEGLSAK